MKRATIFTAERLLTPQHEPLERGGLLVEAGVIQRVLPSWASVRRMQARHSAHLRDLGEGLLAPGYVNAHAHLELTGLAGKLPGTTGFADWIGAMLRQRAGLKDADYVRGVRVGTARLLATGTTTVGDIASTRAAAFAPRTGLRSVVYREVLDAWDPARTGPALDTVSSALPARKTRFEGISPHAPYTTSSALLSGVVELRRRRALRVSIHWAESQAEVDWLADETGPFARFLSGAPRTTGLDLLTEAGIFEAGALDGGASVVHGNHPERGDARKLAQAGVVLVHCPGTHAFFGREPFPFARYRRAGVVLALGTDSSASNEDLDMGREMGLVRAAAPDLAPGFVFDMATTSAARALGLSGQVGVLAPRARADFVLHRFEGVTARGLLDALTRGAGRIAGIWSSGRQSSAVPPMTFGGLPENRRILDS